MTDVWEQTLPDRRVECNRSNIYVDLFDAEQQGWQIRNRSHSGTNQNGYLKYISVFKIYIYIVEIIIEH